MSHEPVMRVLLSGRPSPRALASLAAAAPDVELIGPEGTSPAELTAISAALVWNDAAPLRAAFPRLAGLRWVQISSAGVDGVLFPALVAGDVVLTNAAGVFDRPMAEYVLALVLAHAKGLHETRDAQLDRRWMRREVAPVAGRRAVVVGLGRIGRAAAELLGAAGLHVEGVRRTGGDAAPPVERIFSVAELPAALAGADFVVLTLPLTDETRGIIGRAALDAMGPNAYLVNVGRGPLVDEPELLEAVRERRIAGAALDVFAAEPLPADHPFWREPRIFVSPHIGGDAAGWEEAAVRVWAENLGRFREGLPLENVVDKRRGY